MRPHDLTYLFYKCVTDLTDGQTNGRTDELFQRGRDALGMLSMHLLAKKHVFPCF